MVFTLVEIVIVLCGFAVVGLLFYHVPKLRIENGQNVEFPKLSVIIPARNEEDNLPLLLTDLARQSYRPLEIICVDDGSTDETARIAESFGIKVISLRDKPEGWTGKTWACPSYNIRGLRGTVPVLTLSVPICGMGSSSLCFII